MLIPTTVLTSSGTGLFSAYAYVRDEQVAGTTGGTATTGSFQTRVLNTIVFDPRSIVLSLASNQIELGSGTYFVDARAPFYITGRTQMKLRNVTDGADTLVGGATFATDGGNDETHGFVQGRFTISSTKKFELQYRCNSAADNKNLGVEANYGVAEVYAEVVIYKEI